ncbi:hypothetical protein [Roseovarius rhodophyticola]|uniref:Uncharacterized protein n=1 Tax=Roseovarius rhodophyticola TaxID=3080827 RepID=A0ABZ2TEQ7_9RHOB|nr:hypothetical protein [Roseovarius sp. W115]MDV2928385.1 hypothetical protein [Roseovarius sp. W115]
MVVSNYYPVTQDFGLIETDPVSVADEIQRWWLELGHRLDVKHEQNTLSGFLSELEPLCAVLNKTLLLPAKNRWTVVYRNGLNGSDPLSIARVLSRRMRVRTMCVCSKPDAVFPATMWSVYDPDAVCRRSICAANDGGRWVFEQFGEPFDFENTSSFSARRKKDRFTPEMLATNLSHFQIDDIGEGLFEDGPTLPGILLSREVPKTVMTYSFEEVQNGLPWKT